MFDFFIRREACRLAATAVRNWEPADGSYAPVLWSLTVFFEQYLRLGADGTRDDFGPKEPTDLNAIRRFPEPPHHDYFGPGY